MSIVFNLAYKKKKKAEPITEDTVFYFTSPEAFSIKTPANKTWDGDLEYSQDGDTWLIAGTNSTISQNADGKIYFRGIGNTHLQDSISRASFFAFTGNDISCYGNCLVLLDYKKVEQNDDIEIGSYCFVRLFYGCTELEKPPALPATTLAPYCYYSMFSGCTSLASAPALPATTLPDSCYSSMFYGCTSLVSAPALPAITLASSCYSSMFCGCTSLASAPALPATTLAPSCYYNMFSGCTSLTSAPALPATTLSASCYSSMFYGCTNLVSAPALPATTLPDSCYSSMFYGCTSLASAPALPATTLAEYCYQNMFARCTELEKPPALPATTLASSCYSSMFASCTKLQALPALPAYSMKTDCYYRMFYDTYAKIFSTINDSEQHKRPWRMPYDSSMSVSGNTLTHEDSYKRDMFAATANYAIEDATHFNVTYYVAAIVDIDGTIYYSNGNVELPDGTILVST